MSLNYVVLIADVVASRKFAGGEQYLQDALEGLLSQLNTRFKASIVSKFSITKGDEFEGLLKNPVVIPEIIWTITTSFPRGSLRFGVGYGQVKTKISDEIGKISGPAFYCAQRAIEKARLAGEKNRSAEEVGGVFEGFPNTYDQILTDWGTVLRHIFDKLTSQQRLIFSKLYEQEYLPEEQQKTQREIAIELNIQYQTITNQKRAAGWYAFASGMRGWRLSLEESIRFQRVSDNDSSISENRKAS